MDDKLEKLKPATLAGLEALLRQQPPEKLALLQHTIAEACYSLDTIAEKWLRLGAEVRAFRDHCKSTLGE
jgi:hypothetical protein